MGVHRRGVLVWLVTLALPLCLVGPGWAGDFQSTGQGVGNEPPSPLAGAAVAWMSDDAGAEAPELVRDLIGDESPLALSDEETFRGGYLPGNRFWARAEALGWWTQGMSVGPLVTGSPIANPQGEGVLGQTGTTVLYGGEPQLEGDRWGGRYQIGMWKDACQTIGFQGEYFSLGDSRRFYREGDGTDGVLARPFFNTLTNLPDSELVNYPGVITGSVSVDYSSRLQSAGFLARLNVWRNDPYIDECDIPYDDVCSVTSRLDFLVGYRYMQLDENLIIRENLTSVATPSTQFDIADSFDTRSDFHGAEFGVLYERHRGRLSVELLTKIALGNARDEVVIDGSTATTVNGTTTNFTGGLLAQRTNIGRYEQDSFAVIPEFGLTLGYDIVGNWRATLGYTFIYWNHVVRPGDQIDSNVNPNLLPPEANPFTGPLTPAFAFRDTDYWAQGFNLGLEYVW